MSGTDNIRIIIEAEVKKAVADLKSFQDQAKKSANESGTFVDGLKKGFSSLEGPSGKLPLAFGKIAAAVGVVVGAIAGFIVVGTKFADIAAQQDAALAKLAGVAKASGTSFDAAKNAAQQLASDGLLTFQEAASSLSNLLASGLSLPKAIELLKVAKDNAVNNRQAHLQLGEAVVTFTEGIRNQNSMLTDSVGITKNYSKILEEGAKALGVSASALTKEQEAQIIANGFIKEGAAALGDAARASNTYAGAKAKAEAAVKQFSIAVGQVLQPVMKSIFKAFGEVTEAAGSFIAQLFKLEDSGAKVARLTKQIAELTDWEKKLQAAIDGGNKSRQAANQLSLLKDEIRDKSELLRISTLQSQGLSGELKLLDERIKKQKELSDANPLKRNTVRESGGRTSVTFTESDEAKEYNKLLAERVILEKKIADEKKNAKPAGPSGAIDTDAVRAAQIFKSLEEDKQKKQEETIKKAVELGVIRVGNETDIAAQLKTIGDGQLAARVEAAQKEKQERESLLKEVRDKHLATEEEITSLTNKELKKRIQDNKDAMEAIKYILSGASTISSGIFALETALRKAELDKQLRDLEDNYKKQEDIKTRSGAYTNQFSQQISDEEKARSAEELAEKEADLNEQLAKTTDVKEKEKIQKQLKDIAYQKHLDELKEKERKRADEIAEQKKKAEEEYQEKVRTIKNDAAKKEHGAQVLQAGTSALLAAANALATPPAPNFIASAIALAGGALNTAAVASSPIPQYRTGIDYVPADRLALIHEGERILTKNENSSVSNNLGGITFNINGALEPDVIVDHIDNYLKRYGGFAKGAL